MGDENCPRRRFGLLFNVHARLSERFHRDCKAVSVMAGHDPTICPVTTPRTATRSSRDRWPDQDHPWRFRSGRPASGQGNRIWAITSRRNITGLPEDWGTVQQSKHFNTDCAEKQIKPQICTEKGRVTSAKSTFLLVII